MAQSASARKLVISKVNSVAKKPRKSVSTIELNKRPLNGLPKPGNSTSARRKKLLGSR